MIELEVEVKAEMRKWTVDGCAEYRYMSDKIRRHIPSSDGLFE